MIAFSPNGLEGKLWDHALTEQPVQVCSLGSACEGDYVRGCVVDEGLGQYVFSLV